MMPMRMPGTSSNRRATVLLTCLRTWVRQGYMLPVVSKEKTTSTLLDMRVPPGVGGDYRMSDRECNVGSHFPSLQLGAIVVSGFPWRRKVERRRRFRKENDCSGRIGNVE